MKRQRKIFTVITVFLLLATIVGVITSPGKNTDITLDQSTELTIYTYNSLLADPGYAFDRAFEQYAGLDNGTVKVVYLEDANTIVTKAAAEKNSPVADVIIGLDNVLVEQARDNQILTPYQPSGTENLTDGLVEGLASDYLLTPYDYGVISLYYLKDRLDTDINLDEFVLEDLTQEELAEQTILLNPQTSSPGLGFLLSTIAMYGDDDAGIEGIVEGDWEEYWRELSTNARMTNSWSNAFSLLYNEEEGRPMMISYTTSPAYGACLFNDTSSAALLSHENGQQWGWQQIEGLGLVKDAPHPELAKQFIDWFISADLQQHIMQNQWMYPAHKDITLPDCFDAAIDPSTITPLNDQIPRENLSSFYDDWIDQWEIAWAEGPSGFLSFPYLYFIGFLVTIPIVYKRIKS